MKLSTANRLSEIMRERNLKQTDILTLAKPYCEQYKVKLNKSDLSQYVNGRVNPGQTKLFVLARALDVNEAWLMGCDVPPQREPFDTTEPFLENLSETKQALRSFVDDLTEEQAARALRVLKAAIGEE